jgi:hypothetical protein
MSLVYIESFGLQDLGRFVRFLGAFFRRNTGRMSQPQLHCNFQILILNRGDREEAITFRRMSRLTSGRSQPSWRTLISGKELTQLKARPV